MARFFAFWCERCPTRITVETEVPPESTYPDPEYTGAFDGVAACQAHEAVEDDDGLEAADLCPACASQLHDVDDIFMRNHGSITHDAWRERIKGQLPQK